MTAAATSLAGLVVDDNPVDQHLVASHLGKIRSLKRKLKLDFAGDGREALAKLSATPFEFVVLDWELPLLGKGEVLRQLRKNGSRLPVVVISGLAQHHISHKLKPLQAVFLSKDQMNADTFQSAISQALALQDLNPLHFFEQPVGQTESPRQ